MVEDEGPGMNVGILALFYISEPRILIVYEGDDYGYLLSVLVLYEHIYNGFSWNLSTLLLDCTAIIIFKTNSILSRSSRTN